MEGRASYDDGFDGLDGTELRLGLPGSDRSENLTSVASRVNKRALPKVDETRSSSSEIESAESSHETAPKAKAQVVGWPPIRSYRKNNFMAKKREEEIAGIFVKVSMDGAPYLRKIDLKCYKEYKELRGALENLFKNFSLGEITGIEDAITYEDKDGDWMLVGDVPWEMFISSCKRMRIMRGSEARGLGGSP